VIASPTRAQGAVDAWALGADRFSIKARERGQVVVGFDPARQTAHELARELG
jgi:hypothetical protein